MDKVPAGSMVNIRNDMYLVSEGLRFMGKAKALNVSDADQKSLGAYKKQLDHSTKFIPTWVKVAVAIALGLGTMIGWKRIVVTVGERIGKTHLTYAQGASAEIVAMATIGAAEMYGLPVSTTHVLVLGRRRNHGRESLRPAMGDGAQSADGLGAHPAGVDRALRRPLLAAAHASCRAASRPRDAAAQIEDYIKAGRVAVVGIRHLQHSRARCIVHEKLRGVRFPGPRGFSSLRFAVHRQNEIEAREIGSRSDALATH